MEKIVDEIVKSWGNSWNNTKWQKKKKATKLCIYTHSVISVT